jgi:hypothetical protein
VAENAGMQADTFCKDLLLDRSLEHAPDY